MSVIQLWQLMPTSCSLLHCSEADRVSKDKRDQALDLGVAKPLSRNPRSKQDARPMHNLLQTKPGYCTSSMHRSKPIVRRLQCISPDLQEFRKEQEPCVLCVVIHTNEGIASSIRESGLGLASLEVQQGAAARSMFFGN